VRELPVSASEANMEEDIVYANTYQLKPKEGTRFIFV